MAYHTLTRESGGDDQRRVEEAREIAGLLEEVTHELTLKEREFVADMIDTDYCTTRQLFWLRDIKDKYL